MEDTRLALGAQVSAEVAVELGQRLEVFLGPLLLWLDAVLDKRLVRTFAQLVQVIVGGADGAGLLLSELGEELLSPAQGPAGTKRISNLLRSRRWGHELIERFLWQLGNQRQQALKADGEECLVVWDESVLEKAESLALEGLCAVRSSVAGRLKRIKPGYYHPPSEPIFVPGMHWVGLLVMGMQGRPTLAAMRWWTRRGPLASDKRTEEDKLLAQAAAAWGQDVLHVWDRGFAGSPWLQTAFSYGVRFVVRWPKRYKLVDPEGRKRKAWQIARGKRTWAYRDIWDVSRRCDRRIGCLAIPVRHPDFPDQPLWLVISRQGRGRQPWYLLTNVPVIAPKHAWHVIFAYARRWQIELAWRYSKSELAMESPRLWSWHNRLKLLLIASLAYAFLLSLLDPPLAPFKSWLLRFWAHRTGKRCQDTLTPLYRLRSALSKLWRYYPPPLPAIPASTPG